MSLSTKDYEKRGFKIGLFSSLIIMLIIFIYEMINFVYGWKSIFNFKNEFIKTVLILIIPIMGLFAIFKNKRWNWAVTNSKLFSVLFWLGWFIALVAAFFRIIHYISHK